MLKIQADLLGQDHDLAVLFEHVANRAQAEHIRIRREALQQRLFDAARPFYRHKPRGVAARLARRWKHWRRAG
ncbi:MAG: hypothetical protein ACXU8O_08670 [Asticcacaulis sp.]